MVDPTKVCIISINSFPADIGPRNKKRSMDSCSTSKRNSCKSYRTVSWPVMYTTTPSRIFGRKSRSWRRTSSKVLDLVYVLDGAD